MSFLIPIPGVPERRANKILATLPGVQAAMDRNARRMEGVARANLAPHRKTGEHQIITFRGKVDRHVALIGPAAVALEKGHIHNKTGEHVEGLHVLERAARSQVIG